MDFKTRYLASNGAVVIGWSRMISGMLIQVFLWIDRSWGFDQLALDTMTYACIYIYIYGSVHINIHQCTIWYHIILTHHLQYIVPRLVEPGKIGGSTPGNFGVYILTINLWNPIIREETDQPGCFPSSFLEMDQCQSHQVNHNFTRPPTGQNENRIMVQLTCC